MKASKGMTLLEMLVSLGIFTFMFVFITQVVKQSQRQARQLKKDIYNRSSFDYIVDLIRKDFNSAGFFFDLNDNFKQNFPLAKDSNESKNKAINDVLKKERKSSLKNLPVFLSPYFVFKGEEDKIEFVSYSLTESSSDDSLEQWIQIRYFIQDCPALDKSSITPCFLRSSKRYWNLEREREEAETLVLLRDFKSLRLSYLNGASFLDQEWRDSWKLERSLSLPESSVEFPQELPLPFRVKLEVETQGRKHVWSFNVANFYLRSWNPFSKDFFNFPKWKPPKKPVKPGTRRRSAR
ncbi:MAG: type II secretion system protein [Oligoflexia bacterium]|nr:type II secretion system protein [Oligoflexia bacterium]